MDETRFASTNVLKALHDDRQKQDLGTLGNKTLQQPQPVVAIAPAGGSKTWMMAAGAVIVIALIAGGYVMTRPAPSAPANAVQGAPASAPVEPPATPPNTSRASNNAATPTDKAVVPAAPLASAEKPPVPVRKTPTDAPARASAAPATPPPPAAPAARAAMIAVTMSAAYPFEVRDGARVISPAATSHELPPQPNGKTLRVVAADVFLDQPVKIDGGGEQKFEYSPPGLGRISLRAQRGDCKATIGKSDLGYGPWPKPIPVAAGDYQITLVCPDGQNPVRQTTVTQGLQANVFFTR
jgi:hypothetical protein